MSRNIQFLDAYGGLSENNHSSSAQLLQSVRQLLLLPHTSSGRGFYILPNYLASSNLWAANQDLTGVDIFCFSQITLQTARSHPLH
jgi:hypothetical protein